MAGNDRVFGDAGNDSIGGGAGADVMNGGSNNDFVQGGGGGDSIYGGSGVSNDNLAGDAPRGGGTGNDTFLYSSTEGNDRIFDFSGAPATQDVLDLTEANAAQIEAVFGTTISAADDGVSNVGGNMVVDFGEVAANRRLRDRES